MRTLPILLLRLLMGVRRTVQLVCYCCGKFAELEKIFQRHTGPQHCECPGVHVYPQWSTSVYPL